MPISIPVILGQGAFLVGLFLFAFARPGSRRSTAVPQDQAEPDCTPPDSPANIPLERLPDNDSLAGVPLRILLSERSSPGELLRDTLMTSPSRRF